MTRTVQAHGCVGTWEESDRWQVLVWPLRTPWSPLFFARPAEHHSSKTPGLEVQFLVRGLQLELPKHPQRLSSRKHPESPVLREADVTTCEGPRQRYFLYSSNNFNMQ